MASSRVLLIAIVAMVALIGSANAVRRVTKDNCEVCVTMVEKFIAEIGSNTDDLEGMGDTLRKMCKKTVKKEHRFCYYIGGNADSATGLLQVITKPIQRGLPAEKICSKLREVDSQICDLKYDKPIDWAKIDLTKMRVKELKNILGEWGAQCKGCTEKSDFIKLINELRPKHT